MFRMAIVGQIFFSAFFYLSIMTITSRSVNSLGHVRTHDSIFMDSEIDYEIPEESASSKSDYEDDDTVYEAINSDGDCKENYALQKKLFCNYISDDKTQIGLLKSLDPCLCTHLLYISGSGFSSIEDVNEENFRKAVTLKLKNRNLKILFDMPILDFRPENDTSATEDMDQLMALLTDFVSNGSIDGISLHFDSEKNYTNAKQALNLLFVIEFFRYIAEVNDKPKLILSLILPPNYIDFLDKDAINYLNQFLDYFILPTFRPTHMEKPTHNGLFEYSPDMSKTESIVQALIQTGISKGKLIISLPVFGMTYVLNNSIDANGLFDSRETILSYSQVCNIISSSNWDTINTNSCCSTYVTNNIFWITYSNEMNVQAKVTYTILRRLGGISLSTVNDDDYNGVCRQGNFPLLNKASDILRKQHIEVVKDANDLLIHEESRLLKVFTPLTSEDIGPYNCKRNGYYRDRSNCTRFYQCAKQMPIGARSRFTVFLFECPVGLAFDEEYQVCNFRSWSFSCEASNEISPVPTNMFQCPSPGYHKDPEHCKWFYYCSSFGGSTLKAYEFRCPTSDLAFDAEKMLCNWKNLVPGCEGEQPSSTAHRKFSTNTDSARMAKLFKISDGIDTPDTLHESRTPQRERTRLENPDLEYMQRRKTSVNKHLDEKARHTNNDEILDLLHETDGYNKNSNVFNMDKKINNSLPFHNAYEHDTRKLNAYRNNGRIDSKEDSSNDRSINNRNPIAGIARNRDYYSSERPNRDGKDYLNDRSINKKNNYPDNRTNNNENNFSGDRTINNKHDGQNERAISNRDNFSNARKVIDKNIFPNDRIINDRNESPNHRKINYRNYNTNDSTINNRNDYSNDKTINNRNFPYDRTNSNRNNYQNDRIAKSRKDFSDQLISRNESPNYETDINRYDNSDDISINNRNNLPKTRTISNIYDSPNDETFSNRNKQPNERTVSDKKDSLDDRTISNIYDSPNDGTFSNRNKHPNERTVSDKKDSLDGRTIISNRNGPSSGRTINSMNNPPNNKTISNINDSPNDRIITNRSNFANDRTIINRNNHPNDRTMNNINPPSNDRPINNRNDYTNATTISNRNDHSNKRIINESNNPLNARKPSNEKDYINERLINNRNNLLNDRTIHNRNNPLNDRTIISSAIYSNDRKITNIYDSPNDGIIINRNNFPKDRTISNINDFPNAGTISNINDFSKDRVISNRNNNSNEQIINNRNSYLNDGVMYNRNNPAIDRTITNRNDFLNDRIISNINYNNGGSADWKATPSIPYLPIHDARLVNSTPKDEEEINDSKIPNEWSSTVRKKNNTNGEAKVQCSKMESYQALANNNIADKTQNEHPLGCVSEISVTIHMPKNTSRIERVMKYAKPQDRDRAYGRSLNINDFSDSLISDHFETDVNKLFIETGKTSNYNNPILLLIKTTSGTNLRISPEIPKESLNSQSVTKPSINFNLLLNRDEINHTVSETKNNSSSLINRLTLNSVNRKTTIKQLNNSNLQISNDGISTPQIENSMKKLKISYDEKDLTSNNQYQKLTTGEPNRVTNSETIELSKQTTLRYIFNKSDANSNFNRKPIFTGNDNEGLLLDVNINRQQMSPGVLYVVEPKRWQKQSIPHVEIISLRHRETHDSNNEKEESIITSTFSNNRETDEEYLSSAMPDSVTDKSQSMSSRSRLLSATDLTEIEFDHQSTIASEPAHTEKYKFSTQTSHENDNIQKLTDGLGVQKHLKISSKNSTDQNPENKQKMFQNRAQNYNIMTKEVNHRESPVQSKFISIRQQLLNQNQNKNFLVAPHHNRHNNQNLNENVRNNNQISIGHVQPNTEKPVLPNSTSNSAQRTTKRNDLSNDQKLPPHDAQLNDGIINSDSETTLEEINKIKEHLVLQTLKYSPITTERPINPTRRSKQQAQINSRHHSHQMNSDFALQQWLVLPLNSREVSISANRSNSRMPKRIDLQRERRISADEDAEQQQRRQGVSNSQTYSESHHTQNRKQIFRWNVPFLNEKKHISVPNVACTSEGLFFDPDDCSKFYECYWDQWLDKFTIHMFSCPVTLVFDERISGCVYQDNQAPCIRS